MAAIPLLLWSALRFLDGLDRTTDRLWHSPTCNRRRFPFNCLGLLGIAVSAMLIGILLTGVARVFRKWLATELGFPDWMFAVIFRLIPWLIVLRADHDLSAGPRRPPGFPKSGSVRCPAGRASLAPVRQAHAGCPAIINGRVSPHVGPASARAK